MKRTELKKLFDLDKFYLEVEQIADECNCTLLEAVQEYGRIHEIEDDMLATIVRSARGKFKDRFRSECEDLRLIA